MLHRIAILFVLFVGLVGCGEPTKEDPTKRDTSLKQVSEDGRFEVTYGSFASPEGKSLDAVPRNELFTMVLTIKDTKGASAWEKAPAVRAEMPEHGHGMNTKTEVTAKGEGSFLVKGMLLHMPGWWRMVVELDVDGKKQEIVFNIELS
jgi:hypothetical protein